jgi:hypothetical protein
LSLAGYSLETREAPSGTYGLPHPGLHAALIEASPGIRAQAIAALDDWSGSFDIHLGVHSSD